jgi:3-oxoacyl-[acyl-carrier-protein] synthase II
MMQKAVVTGMGVVSPLGNRLAAFWENLAAGKSGIRAVAFDTEKIASKIAGTASDVTPAGLGPKDLRRQSRVNLFAMEAADQAVEQAGFNMDREDPWRCGVFIGSGIGGIGEIEDNVIAMYEKGPRRISPFFLPRGLSNMPAGAVAIRHGFQGPNKAIVTACATGTQNIGAAADLIRLGKADVMLAGGTESAIIPFALASFSAIRALSTRNDAPEKASRPFDADRDGFVMGEGAGVLLLESEKHARERGAAILAEVAGMGESCDAYHAVAPRPDGAGPAMSMRRALDQGGINPEEVDYVNAHGTSTELNDPSETLALKRVFGESMPPVSSTKSMIGHLLGAAGAVEAIACVQSMLEGVIHPSINYETPDPACAVNLAANTAREARLAITLSNSLGFGGHNATIVFRRYAR